MNNTNVLEGYETVKQRKKRFYEDFPGGSLISEIFYHERDHVVIRGMAFKNKEDQEKNLPSGVGHAEEFKGIGGFANKVSWMENCDESAIGRALDNAGYSGNNKCSKEEMQKIENHKEVEKIKGNFEDAVKELNSVDLKSLGITAKKIKESFVWTDEENDRLRIVCQDRIPGSQ